MFWHLLLKILRRRLYFIDFLPARRYYFNKVTDEQVWLPLSLAREVVAMTTYEALSLMIMFGMFVIAVLKFRKK